MSGGADTILLVGASGPVATKLVSGLASQYRIVGMSGTRDDLAALCADFVLGDLTSDSSRLFETVFSKHRFCSIIWNVVQYNPGPLIEAGRGSLHVEFDLGIALPLECLRTARAYGFAGTFILVTSGLAFSVKPAWGSYSITKRGQVLAAEYLANELRESGIFAKAIALGAIADLTPQYLSTVFAKTIANAEPDTVLYAAYQTPGEMTGHDHAAA